MTWLALAFTVPAILAIAAALRGLDGALPQGVVALAVGSAVLATLGVLPSVLVVVAGLLLGAFVALLARRRIAFQQMRPRRSTAVALALFAAMVIVLSNMASARDLGQSGCQRMIVSPGGFFWLKQDGYAITGPYNLGTRCEVRVTKDGATRTLPLSTPLGTCGWVGTLLCEDSTLSIRDAGVTTRYAFPSLDRLDAKASGPPRLFFWLATFGFLLALAGIVAAVRRTRALALGGPYREAAIVVESVAPEGIAPASVAAFILIAPLAGALLMNLFR